MASIAHVGYGYWGKNIARNLSELGALGAVVDFDPAAAAAGARALGTRTLTFEEALADASIDGVSLASPASMHHGHAKAALEAGKHVFVEKPLALKVENAEALCTLAAAAGRKLMVGHLLQYHPVYARLRQMVEAGELGRLLHVQSSRMSLGKFRTEENVLWSFAPHDISMLLGLTGSSPVHVEAQGTVAYTPGVADAVTVHMHFPGGVSGLVQASWMHPFKEQRLVAIGEKATAVFEDSEADWNAKLRLYRHSVDMSGRVPEPRKADAEMIVVPKGEPLKAECAHFIECIDTGREPLTNGAEGLRVLKVLQQAETRLADNLQRQYAAANE